MHLVNENIPASAWINKVIKPEEYEHYLVDGKDFIDDEKIWQQIEASQEPSLERVREILAKSYAIKTLDPEELATLIKVKEPAVWQEIFEMAARIKHKIYDNRIITFAPVYCSNHCVNNCLYCGFRSDNTHEKRERLNMEQIKAEAEAIAGRIGHKRVIAVFGEHPDSDADYIADAIKSIYSVSVKTRKGHSEIRRVNINAAPLCVDDLRKLHEVGIGTYQVFQETYHHATYGKLHPANTIKGNYQWRLYVHHRAYAAGIDDVAIGCLFGLYDWRFDLMGLLYHAIELEQRFGVGPHTISFPRLTPASNSPLFELADQQKYFVSDEDFKKIVALLRLAVPYTGLIITAREKKEVRDDVLPVGCTQTDASTMIGIGGYAKNAGCQNIDEQQFMLGDTRSLEELIYDLAQRGVITSFCTAGYRCGRTGDQIMDLLKKGQEKHFCKLNAILTYREWLDDFASEKTRKAGEEVIRKEIEEVKKQTPSIFSKKLYDLTMSYYERISNGERDLFI
ncbi:MAG: [FeFe] hydrogenase H-cluster radical SAM maturase HydG [Candidatus Riflebacteria bacterium HGW-Riflebacteria-2]|jgi:2-iminoacetate synthase|nr:MAG: [FeFe] hydrogenase H-cluster radical SAM maturase HydG [Candidatus Riflebacteria bacterium HGW-Riflebacteria-2]